jgi:outer membrane protein assembly factor BamB
MTNILQDKDGDVHGRVYALDVQTGALRWEFKLDSQVGKLLAADGRVFFGATDGTMRCLSLDAGEVLWSACTVVARWEQREPIVQDDEDDGDQVASLTQSNCDK